MAYLALLLLALMGRNSMAYPPLIDLSHTYYTDPPASHKIEILEKSMNRIEIGVELFQMCSSEHAGTHLEAPITFNKTGLSVDEIPFERLWRVPGVLMNVSPFVYPEYKITADVLQRWENMASSPIPDGGVILINTGFSHSDYFSNDGVEENAPRHQPSLSEDAGMWLVSYGRRHGLQKGIIGIGIDLDSLDENDTNETTSVRSKLYAEDIYALHNLKNLFMLPPSGFLVTVMPMKINKGAGAPARVLAERADTRYPQPGRNSSEDGRNYWHSERDYMYPYPMWGIASMASAESSYRFNLVPVLSLLTVQYFSLKVLV